MPDAPDQPLLDAILDSWDRNNRILVNLLRAVPEDAFDLKPTETSPNIGKLFNHMHYTRVFFLSEDAPEFAIKVPEGDEKNERSRDRLAQMLNQSAQAVGNAVRARVQSSRAMEVRYDHPILMLQHLIWHEGYHHGQIKLALKQAGTPITNEEASPISWGIWMRKTATK